MPLAHRYPRLARARLRTEMTFVMMLLGLLDGVSNMIFDGIITHLVYSEEV